MTASNFDDSLKAPEIWRSITGYVMYEISSHGRVKSNMSHPTNSYGDSGHILAGYLTHDKAGRPKCMIVSLWDGKRFRVRKVHSLVLSAFVGEATPGMIGCHGDGDPTHNWLSNLRWDTHASNSADAKRHGTAKAPPLHAGEGQHHAKLTVDGVRCIRAEPYFKGVNQMLSRAFWVTPNTIGDIRRGKSWAHIL